MFLQPANIAQEHPHVQMLLPDVREQLFNVQKLQMNERMQFLYV